MLVQKLGGRDHKAHYALKMTSLNRAALVERDILPRLENVPYTLDLAYAFFDPRLSKAYLVLRKYLPDFCPPVMVMVVVVVVLMLC